MDLLQLKYFCHAASTQNFSKTALEFRVPPSNISQCIKRLESELGITLFIRSANRLQLSPQGELLYQGVQKALDTLDSTLFAVKTSVSNESIHLAICLHRQNIMRVIESFQSKFPGIQITYERPHKPALGFSTKGYDILIADDDVDDPDFEKEHISRAKCALIAPKDLLPKGEITAELLAQQTFLSLPPGSYMYRNTQRLFQELNISPPILAEEQHSIYFVPRNIEARRGVAFAPVHTRWVEHMTEFLEVYDIGNVYNDVYLFRRKESNSPYVINLCDSIRNEYRRTAALRNMVFPDNTASSNAHGR